jgi:four helix bundle protein
MGKYQNLDAWKISMDLVKETYQLIKTYPKDELYGLTSQTKRAATSVPCNIAEGMGRQYKKDTIQFLHISRGSLYELETLFNIAIMVGIIGKESFVDIGLLVEKNLQVLNGLINYLEKSELK